MKRFIIACALLCATGSLALADDRYPHTWGAATVHTENAPRHHRHRGAVQRQSGVTTSCFPASLRSAIASIRYRFGDVVITHGLRHRHGRRGGNSLHYRCMAADLRVPGVPNSTVARFARTLPQIGGVGTYTRHVHIDVGARKFAWWGGNTRGIRLASR